MGERLQRAWDWVSGVGRKAMSGLGAAPKGVPWPPTIELPRLQGYTRYTQLYAGEHEDVYVNKGKYKFDSGRPWMTVNLCARLSDLLTWRLFGEGVRLEAPKADVEEDEEADTGPPATQQYIDHLYQRNELSRALLSSAVSGSYKGDSVLKVRYDADARAILIEAVKPNGAFVETDTLNENKILSIALAQVLRKHTGEYFLWIERHELREGAGWITNTLWKLSGDPTKGTPVNYEPDKPLPLNTLDATAELPEEIATGVDDLLVVLVPNGTAPEGGVWGVSDYVGLDVMQGELDNRMTQRAEILDKHADPVMYGPHPPNTEGEVDMGRDSAKYLGWTPDSGPAPVGYVVWDASLAAVENEIRELTEKIAVCGNVDIAALVPPIAGGPISGRALRLSQLQTQATVQSKQLTWTPGLQRVTSVATKLFNAEGVEVDWEPAEKGNVDELEPEDVTIVWNDGLPQDQREIVEEQVMLVEAGLTTRPLAIQEITGLDEADAETVAEDIQKEAQRGAPPAALPLERLLGAGPQFGVETEEV